MRLSAKEAIDKIVECYREKLGDNWSLIEIDLNQYCKGDLFKYDDKTHEMVLKKNLQNHPHYRVEYDLNYWGGNYDGIGQFTFIPEGLEVVVGSVDEAFEKVTGINRQHIIYYCLDERFLFNGTEWVNLHSV